MGSKHSKGPQSPSKPQRKIDAGDFTRSRQTWTPDWDKMEEELEAINRELLLMYPEPKKRKRSA